MRSNPAPKWAHGWGFGARSWVKRGTFRGGGGSLCHPANVSMMYFPCPAFDPSRKKEKKKKHGVRVPALPNKREEIPG